MSAMIFPAIQDLKYEAPSDERCDMRRCVSQIPYQSPTRALVAHSSAAPMLAIIMETMRRRCYGSGRKAGRDRSRRPVQRPRGPARCRDRGVEPALVRKEHRASRYRRATAGVSPYPPVDGGNPGRARGGHWAPCSRPSSCCPWNFSEEAAAEKHMAQLQHNAWVTASRTAVLSIITGGRQMGGNEPFRPIRSISTSC